MLSLLLLFLLPESQPLAISSGHCQKNISLKYQLPVVRTNSAGEEHIVYEDRTRSETLSICCPGYIATFFGLCEPICELPCPANSYCSEPNKCSCRTGYEHSHHPNKQHQLICRPVCHGGCPEHSHCVMENVCKCRPGFHDVSGWFRYEVQCERIQCGHEQRFDVELGACVKVESMSMEELIQQVAKRLAKGLGTTEPV